MVSCWSVTVCLTDSRSFTWWPPASGAYLHTVCVLKPGQMFVAAGPSLCSRVIRFLHKTFTPLTAVIAVTCFHQYAPGSPHILCNAAKKKKWVQFFIMKQLQLQMHLLGFISLFFFLLLRGSCHWESKNSSYMRKRVINEENLSVESIHPTIQQWTCS